MVHREGEPRNASRGARKAEDTMQVTLSEKTFMNRRAEHERGHETRNQVASSPATHHALGMRKEHEKPPGFESVVQTPRYPASQLQSQLLVAVPQTAKEERSFHDTYLE